MIVPVAAVADMVATSATSFRIIPKVDDEPENVCVAVKVLATLITAILAAAKVVCPVPPLAIGKVPVTPVVSGKPVRLVATPLVGVPSKGVTKVGEVDNTLLPEPVLVATPVPPLATANVPARVMVPEPVIGPPLVVKPVVPPETSTLVTDPAPGPVKATVMAPLPLVIVTPEPAVSVAGVSVLPVLLPINS